MTRNLIFLRHAHAPEKNITNKGVAQAISSGLQLRKSGLHIDQTLHSPKIRAHQTSNVITRACNGIVPAFSAAGENGSARFPSIQEAQWLDNFMIAGKGISLSNMHDQIKNFDDEHGTVCLVGHCDDMPILIEYFGAAGLSAKGSYNAEPVWLQFEAERWEQVTRSRLTGMKHFSPYPDAVPLDQVEEYALGMPQ